MDITTVSIDKSTRNQLREMKEAQEFEHYDATVSWLLTEVKSNN